MTLLEAALAYAAHGIPVFPCHPIEKYPLTPKDKDANGKPIPGTGGFYKATTDQIVIRGWWTQRPDAAIGMPTGSRSGIDVLDIDAKNGKDGFVALKASGINWTELSPIRVRSRNAGGHGYFRANGAAPSIVLSGVDVQSDGKYVILPPSPGYDWVGLGLLNTNLERLPAWPEALKGLSTKPNGANKSERISGPPEASIEDVVAALRVIPNEDTIPRKDVSWDEWNLIGMLVYRATDGMGLEEWEEWSAKSDRHRPDKCEERWEHWTSSSPPTTGGAGTLFRLADEAAGGSHWRPSRSVAAEAEFEAIEAKLKRRHAPTREEWDGALTAVKYLIDKVVMADATQVFFGDTNVGKSIIVLDMAMHVALGLPYRGRKVRQGMVVYVAAEGGKGMMRRVRAWLKKHNVDMHPVDVPILFLPYRFHINTSGDFAELSEEIAEAEARHNLKAAWIILDTLSRTLAGSDSDQKDMANYVQAMDRMRERFAGSNVSAIHHTGKDKTRGARGPYLLKCAMDVEIELTPGVVHLDGKVRDAKVIDGSALCFDIEEVDLGVDEEGERITAPVAVARTSAEVDFSLPFSPHKRSVFEQTAAGGFTELTKALKIFARHVRHCMAENETDRVTIPDMVCYTGREEGAVRQSFQRLITAEVLHRIGRGTYAFVTDPLTAKDEDDDQRE